MATIPMPPCHGPRAGGRSGWAATLRRTGSARPPRARLRNAPIELPQRIRQPGFGFRPRHVIKLDRGTDLRHWPVFVEPLVAAAVEGAHLLADRDPAGGRLAGVHC